jgi:hypothetical protein
VVDYIIIKEANNNKENNMFYIPETLEGIKAKIKELNDHATKCNDYNAINYFYVQALIQAFYEKQIDSEEVA